MRARSFFWVCAGLFLLVAAYSMGASSVQGQASPAGTNTVEFVGMAVASNVWVVTKDGTVYVRHANGTCEDYGNPLGTVQVESTTITDMKTKYREGQQ